MMSRMSIASAKPAPAACSMAAPTTSCQHDLAPHPNRPLSDALARWLLRRGAGARDHLGRRARFAELRELMMYSQSAPIFPAARLRQSADSAWPLRGADGRPFYAASPAREAQSTAAAEARAVGKAGGA